ncbi:MAG: hypothetical protein LBI15_12105 [Dysgonamonadaceae bacterium]|jgi:hypothetical protein|nr:hypothetical protein [Dysgonamonadaceae bacterium]
MRKFRIFILMALIAAILLPSCSQDATFLSDVEMTELVSALEEITLPTDSLVEDLVVIEETEELKALKEQFEKLKGNQLRSSGYSYDATLWNNLYAIRDRDVRIFTAVNQTNKVLSTNGVGRELILVGSHTNESQLFNIKVLPASTGIPYMIYSKQTKTPIVVGHPVGQSNNKLLMAKADNSGSSFGAGWDFIPANGFVAIQSTDIFGQGSSGSWWDIFNFTAQAEATRTSMAQYNQLTKQHFRIQPTQAFTLSSVKYVNQWSAKMTKRPTLHQIITPHTNSKSIAEDVDIPVSDWVNHTYRFAENVRNIDFSVTIPSNLRFKSPEIAGGKLFLTPSHNIPADLIYNPNVSQTIRKELKTVVPFRVPANTRLDLFYFFSVYDVEVEYEAIAISGDREIKLIGTWRGVIYVDDIPESAYALYTNLKTLQTRTVNLGLTEKKERVIL